MAGEIGGRRAGIGRRPERLCLGAPQQEGRSRRSSRQDMDNLDSERLPTTVHVAADDAHLDGQNRIEQKQPCSAQIERSPGGWKRPGRSRASTSKTRARDAPLPAEKPAVAWRRSIRVWPMTTTFTGRATPQGGTYPRADRPCPSRLGGSYARAARRPAGSTAATPAAATRTPRRDPRLQRSGWRSRRPVGRAHEFLAADRRHPAARSGRRRRRMDALSLTTMRPAARLAARRVVERTEVLMLRLLIRRAAGHAHALELAASSLDHHRHPERLRVRLGRHSASSMMARSRCRRPPPGPRTAVRSTMKSLRHRQAQARSAA